MERSPTPQDYSQERDLAQRVSRIFGYDGLVIEIREGAGWQTQTNGDQTTLIVDPTMLQPKALKDAAGRALPEGSHIPEHYSIYGIAHELGHVDDYMQPDRDLQKERGRSSAEAFFWNALDDGVINRRLRNIPLLNGLTDTVYKDILFPGEEYADLPKHLQFMYGWLFNNVTPDRTVTFDPEVQQALDSLHSYKIGRKRYDLYRSLSHSGTSFAERHRIAEQYILPLYQSFLDKDEESEQESDGQQSDQSAGQGDPNVTGSGGTAGMEQWDDMYEAYADASHCGDHSQDNHPTAGNGVSDQNPHEAIAEAGKALREIREAQAAAGKSGQQHNAAMQPGQGAGSVAAELNLSPDDAIAYQNIVSQYRSQIQEVAKVFQQLTVPSVEYTSPRYRKHASTSGLKLSPRDLFQVVIAQHSDIDPAIWKPIETISKREGYSFNGLDIHLLIDASGSMSGSKAESAAASGVILMEGLDSARRMVERYNARAPKPDVRLQVVLFGSSSKVVVPLSSDVKPADKGSAFTTVREAASSSTLVDEALRITTVSAEQNPKRTQLVYIITDGDFHDHISAVRTMRSSPSNYNPYEIILQAPGTTPIVQQSSHLTNPQELPGALYKHLKIVAAHLAQ